MISGVAYEPRIFIILPPKEFYMDLLRLVKREILDSDACIEVVDARCPAELRCRKLEKFVEKLNKPYWIVINKVDLVPKEFADRAKKVLKEQSNVVDVIHVSATKYYGFNILKWSLKRHLGTEEKKRLCVFGYPNVGKSSLINMLARRKKASVAPRPGHTRGKQWIRITRNIVLSDTPGVIPPEMAEKEWRPILFPAEDLENAALTLLKKIKNAEGNNFKEVYGFEFEEEEEALEEIAKRLNFISRGNRYDTKRAAKRVIDDWNRGKLVGWWL